MIATTTGIIYVGLAVAKAIPKANPSKKLWIADPKIFIYPAAPFPFKF